VRIERVLFWALLICLASRLETLHRRNGYSHRFRRKSRGPLPRTRGFRQVLVFRGSGIGSAKSGVLLLPVPYWVRSSTPQLGNGSLSPSTSMRSVRRISRLSKDFVGLLFFQWQAWAEWWPATGRAHIAARTGRCVGRPTEIPVCGHEHLKRGCFRRVEQTAVFQLSPATGLCICVMLQ
jgi:hypothetical protein